MVELFCMRSSVLGISDKVRVNAESIMEIDLR